jgi:hypothetical protein
MAERRNSDNSSPGFTAAMIDKLSDLEYTKFEVKAVYARSDNYFTQGIKVTQEVTQTTFQPKLGVCPRCSGMEFFLVEQPPVCKKCNKEQIIEIAPDDLRKIAREKKLKRDLQTMTAGTGLLNRHQTFDSTISDINDQIMRQLNERDSIIKDPVKIREILGLDIYELQKQGCTPEVMLDMVERLVSLYLGGEKAGKVDEMLLKHPLINSATKLYVEGKTDYEHYFNILFELYVSSEQRHN